MCERGEPWKSYWYYIRMILIGRYDSPYVRRVGVSLHALAIPFELLPLSPFSQASQLRQFSPIGRMPADPHERRGPHRECSDPRLPG